MLYNVDATDDEGDSITYSMTVVPSTSSSHYRIDPRKCKHFSYSVVFVVKHPNNALFNSLMLSRENAKFDK